MNPDHLGLLIGLTQRKNKFSCIFMTAGNCTTWSKAPIKVEAMLLCAHRDWEARALSSLVITFQRSLWNVGIPRSLRKTVLGYKTGKSPLKRLFLKKVEKEFAITSFLSKCTKKRGERPLWLGHLWWLGGQEPRGRKKFVENLVKRREMSRISWIFKNQ